MYLLEKLRVNVAAVDAVYVGGPLDRITPAQRAGYLSRGRVRVGFRWARNRLRLPSPRSRECGGVAPGSVATVSAEECIDKYDTVQVCRWSQPMEIFIHFYI